MKISRICPKCGHLNPPTKETYHNHAVVTCKAVIGTRYNWLGATRPEFCNFLVEFDEDDDWHYVTHRGEDLVLCKESEDYSIHELSEIKRT